MICCAPINLYTCGSPLKAVVDIKEASGPVEIPVYLRRMLDREIRPVAEDMSGRFGVETQFVPLSVSHRERTHPRVRSLGLTSVSDSVPSMRAPVVSDRQGVFGELRCTPVTPSLVRDCFSTLGGYARQVSQQVDSGLEARGRQILPGITFGSVVDNTMFQMVYQPIVDVGTGVGLGYEALARFPASLGSNPEAVLTLAEAAGVLVPLEFSLAESAIHGFLSSGAQGYLSVNLSPAAVLSDWFRGLLCSDLPLSRLVLELTEHECIADYQVIRHCLDIARTRGVRVAIDDVGAGFASFRHILELRPDMIKLDRSIIDSVDSRAEHAGFVRMVAGYAAEFGCRCVAEGVERESQRDVLLASGISAQQGYLHGRPAPLRGAVSMSAPAYG